jgi:hypothetical protein
LKKWERFFAAVIFQITDTRRLIETRPLSNAPFPAIRTLGGWGRPIASRS